MINFDVPLLPILVVFGLSGNGCEGFSCAFNLSFCGRAWCWDVPSKSASGIGARYSSSVPSNYADSPLAENNCWMPMLSWTHWQTPLTFLQATVSFLVPWGRLTLYSVLLCTWHQQWPWCADKCLFPYLRGSQRTGRKPGAPCEPVYCYTVHGTLG